MTRVPWFDSTPRHSRFAGTSRYNSPQPAGAAVFQDMVRVGTPAVQNPKSHRINSTPRFRAAARHGGASPPGAINCGAYGLHAGLHMDKPTFHRHFFTRHRTVSKGVRGFSLLPVVLNWQKTTKPPPTAICSAKSQPQCPESGAERPAPGKTRPRPGKRDCNFPGHVQKRPPIYINRGTTKIFRRPAGQNLASAPAILAPCAKTSTNLHK